MKQELLEDSIHLATWVNATPVERFKMVSNTEKVTSKERLALNISYPLRESVFIGLEQKGGFTISRLLDGIAEAYEKIYSAEYDSMQAAESPTKYGIWGHDLSDLYVESLYIVDSEVKIGMGS